MDQAASSRPLLDLLASQPDSNAGHSDVSSHRQVALAGPTEGFDLSASSTRPTPQPVPCTPPSPAPPRFSGRQANQVGNEDPAHMAIGTLGPSRDGEQMQGSEAQATTIGCSDQGATGKHRPAVLGLGPPPVLASRQPLRQTSSSSAVPLSAPAAAFESPSSSLTAATLPARARSASPTPPVNIFAIPISPMFTASPDQPRRRTELEATGPSVTAMSSAAVVMSLSQPIFGPAKDITLDEDPFAPAGTISARHAAIMSSAGSTPGRSGRSTTFDSGSSSSSSPSEDDIFPYPHILRTRQNHTSHYPSGRGSPSSIAQSSGSGGLSHRHQASLPQDFVFSTPLSSSSSSGASSSVAPDPDSTLPNGSSPRRPPPTAAARSRSALPKRSFARSVSQPERSNILNRPPAFDKFVSDLPPYREASAGGAHPPSDVAREEPPLADGADSVSGRRRPGARTTSLTMQRAQREALKESQEHCRVALTTSPAISSPAPASQEAEHPDVDDADARSIATTPADERRELLMRPLGLLALSQALSAAGDEVDTLRATVRETTGLVIDQACWVAQAAAAVQTQGGWPPPSPQTRKWPCDEKTSSEIDELSGSEAREALKILVSTSAQSLAAITLVRTIHSLVHSAPGSVETDAPTDDDVFTDENLSMLEGTLVAWRRMARAGAVASGGTNAQG